MEQAEARVMRRLRLPNPWKEAWLRAEGRMSAANGQRPAPRGRPRRLLWRLQGLLRRREAESVRDRVEELVEAPHTPRASPSPAAAAPTSTPRSASCSATC